MKAVPHKGKNGLMMALLVIISLFGCTPPAAAPAPRPLFPPTSIATPPPTPAPTDLLVIGSFTGAAGEQMQTLLTRFGEENGIAVTYRGNGEVATLLKTSIEEGRTPDVILLPKRQWVGELASAGAILPLPAPVANTVRANFGAAWVESVTMEGQVYGVPFDANLKSLLWYRPAALDNPSALTSLATLEQTAAQLSDSNQPAFAVPGGAGWPLTDWFENVLLATAGVEVYDGLIAHTVAWTDTRVVAAAQQFVTLLGPDHVLGGTNGATQLPLDQEIFNRVFVGGESDFWLGQGSTVSTYATQVGLTAGADYDVIPFPTGGTEIVIGSVAVAGTNRPESMALLAYLATPAAVDEWVQAGGLIAAHATVSLETYPSLAAQREAQLLSEATTLRPDLSDALPPALGFPYLGDQLRQMLLRPADVEIILREIEAVATREQGSVPQKS